MSEACLSRHQRAPAHDAFVGHHHLAHDEADGAPAGPGRERRSGPMHCRTVLQANWHLSCCLWYGAAWRSSRRWDAALCLAMLKAAAAAAEHAGVWCCINMSPQQSAHLRPPQVAKGTARSGSGWEPSSAKMGLNSRMQRPLQQAEEEQSIMCLGRPFMLHTTPPVCYLFSSRCSRCACLQSIASRLTCRCVPSPNEEEGKVDGRKQSKGEPIVAQTLHRPADTEHVLDFSEHPLANMSRSSTNGGKRR